MLDIWQISLQLEFLIDIILALAAGFVIGTERESRGKPAGISIRYKVRWSSITNIHIPIIL